MWLWSDCLYASAFVSCGPLTPSGGSTDTVGGSRCSEDLQPDFSQGRGPEASYLCSQFSMMERPYLPKCPSPAMILHPGLRQAMLLST